MILSRRISLITATALFLVSLIFVAFFPSATQVFLLLSLSALTLVLAFRVFGAKLLWIGILAPLVYLASTYFVFIKFPLINLPFKLALCAVFSVFYYYLLLSVNTVLLCSLENKSFPLLRAGKTVIYITTLFAAFLSYTVIYKFEYIFIFYFSSVFAVTFLLSVEYFWSQKVGVGEDAGKKNLDLFEPLIISIFVSEMAALLSFFPTEAFFRALAASSTFYVLLGLSENIASHKITKKMYLEYILILIIIFVILVVA
ncbi:hypothetical protein COV27_01450 [candidate division WWE3 bacterium CG10_big_fil_rev_8_21_14_0_10_39_14]|nr:MAG: hypothetical protein COV27_01450 [candidate division WWE3 bacterium CG10_big_fil_rev_8_21_14_0_10_39_14]